MTAQTWIDETKNLLLTDYVEEHDQLSADLSTSDTTVAFTYDSSSIVEGSIIEVDLVKCVGKSYCRSDADIEAYFRGYFIFLLKNEIRFDQQKYGIDAIILESNMDNISVGSWQHRTHYQISLTELSLQDLAVNFNDYTEF